MTAQSYSQQNSVVPLLRYRDLARAMEWLREVFGFERQLAVSDAEGEIVYGQMRYGSSLIMLGTVRDTDLDGFMTQPDEVGGFETQTCYVVIEDAEEHFSRSVMAGADILLELRSDAQGRRGYACRDPEGHIWNFGTFHPTAVALTTTAEPEQVAPVAPQGMTWRTRLAIAASLMIAAFSGFAARDVVPSNVSMPFDASMPVAAEEGTADYAYQLLAVVRGEARQLAAERDGLKRDLDAMKTAKAELETQVTSARTLAESETSQRKALEVQLADAREAIKVHKAAADAMKAKVQEAEAKLEDVPREKTAADAAQTQAERDAQERSAAVMQDGTRAIETSATTPPAETAEPPKAAMPETEQKAEDGALVQPEKPQPHKRAPALKKQQTADGLISQPRYKPTYVIELSDVPWPYTNWHQREIKRH